MPLQSTKRRVSTLVPLRPLTDGPEFEMRHAVEVAAARLVDSGEDASISVEVIDTNDQWEIQLDGDSSSSFHRLSSSPKLLLRATSDTWCRVATGDLAPYIAIATRRMAIEGDLGLAMRLLARLSEERVWGVPHGNAGR